MRIAYIAASVIPSWTANSVQVMKVCQALTQNGHEVHLFVPGKITTSWNDLRTHYGIQNVFPVHWLRFNPLLKKLDFVLTALKQTKKLQLDLIYTRLLWAAVLASWIRLPVILEVHDRPVGKMGPWLFKRFLKSQGTKRIVLITSALKTILEQENHLQFNPREILIAPDGVDLERYKNRVDTSSARNKLGIENRFTAMYTGGFYEGRGLESLVELAKRFPEVSFLWAGGKIDVVTNWQKKLEDSGVQNIHLTGFVSNEELPMYQMAADVLLMPYGKVIAGSSGGNIADVSSPMKMFEYMAAGRVILTSDMPVLREVLNETNAAFYNSEDMQSMESVFVTLMQNEEMRTRLASQALIDVEKYSWRKRMLNIVSSVDGLNMKLIKQLQIYILAILGISILIGTTVSAFSPGEFLAGFWRTVLFSLILVVIMAAAVWFLKPGSTLVVIAAVAILLRLAVGIGLYLTLPDYGYDTDVQNAGYSYSDAFVRDQGSYLVAFPERTDNGNTSEINLADQYGGLSMISVVVYRLFSADVHRPLLMILFSAFAIGLASLFTWQAIRLEWGDKVALITVIALAAYPEGIILGSSQMREPVLIAMVAISFWAIVTYKQGMRKIEVYLLFGVATLLACWISLPAGLVILMVESGFLMLDRISKENGKKRKLLKFGIFIIFLIVAIIAGWGWLKNTLYYDAYLTESESGMVAYIIKIIGTQWRIPFVLLYGLIQPVLPAALVYQSLPVWKGIAIFRAVGWYVVIPFLLYGIGAVWKDARKNQNWGLLWLTLLVLVWIVVSSARAGGDQWDNPRYRAIFLPWLALIIGWVWQHLRHSKSAWFWRIVFLELAFVLLFSNWYLNRILAIGIPIPINILLIVYSALLIIVVVSGLIWDYKRKKLVTNDLPSP